MKTTTNSVSHPVRVAIVDSLASCRIGIGNHLKNCGGISIAWSSATAEEAYEKLGSDIPDLLIIDIQLSGQDGLEFIKNLQPLYPHLRILVHSSLREEFYAMRSIRAGAMGFLHKASPMGELAPAVRKVLSGEIFLSGASVKRAISGLRRMPLSGGIPLPGDQLTDREIEIITLMGYGDSCQDTADKLRISPRTVQVHRTNIRQKLGLDSAARLHAYAVRFFGDSQSQPEMADEHEIGKESPVTRARRTAVAPASCRKKPTGKGRVRCSLKRKSPNRTR